MKHFNAVIEQLIQMHKDTNTLYSPTTMFDSANALSFAISRLMDAEKILNDESWDDEELTPEQQELWCELRESMPQETAQNLAICIINNTPLSKTEQEIDTVKNLFNEAMNDFTGEKELSQAFTDIFFSSDRDQTKNDFHFKDK